MKKWVLHIDKSFYTCDLVQMFTSTFKLLLSYDGKTFLVTFDDLEQLLEAKDGIARPVYISNESGKKYKHGFAVFKIPKK